MSRRLAASLAILCLASCVAAPPGGLLPVAGRSRLVTYGDHEQSGIDIELAAEVVDGEHIHLPLQFLFDVDGMTSLWMQWHPFGVKHDNGWRTSSSGELLFGVHQRIGGPRDMSIAGHAAAFSIEAFAISPHGGAKPARWPGVIENQEGYYVFGSGEIGSEQLTLALNAGTGVGGRPGRSGHSSRLLGGGALTYALPSTGIDFATEPSRISVETFWTRDALDDRTFGELAVGLAVWLGTTELDIGYRRGLTDATPEHAFYIGFRSRAFDTFSF